MFLAEAQNSHLGPTQRFVSHSTRSSSDLSRVFQEIIAEVSPSASVRFDDFRTQLRGSLLRERLVALLSSAFGVLALLLATVGIYGVVSYGVSRRRGEIGVRMALGADRGAIVRMVLVDAMQVVGIGLGAGTLVALLVTLVFGLEPHDASTLAGAVLVMVLSGRVRHPAPGMARGAGRAGDGPPRGLTKVPKFPGSWCGDSMTIAIN